MENEIVVNGETYVKKDQLGEAEPIETKPYVIVRTYSAGVFAGYLEERDGRDGTMINVRRLWYWDGACSLSQLAKDGTSNPKNCKFSVSINRIDLTEIIEVDYCTETARKNIQKVQEWKK